ncbi:MAG TPA: hypothetical protein PK736_09690, partial [Bacteroidia bacterium]|nr:hypothetical protein [Bacteroidia bacterium]
GLVVGTYTVTVTDANGCTKTCVIELADPAELQAGAIPTDETCEYLNNGMVEVQAIGGTGLFTVNIVGGVVNETVTGISFNYIFDSLAAGNYIITVTDANGCSTQFSTDVFEPAPLAVTQTITQVACNGAATGAIDITVAG